MKTWQKVAAGILAVAAVGGAGFFSWYQLVKAGVLKYNEHDRRQRGTMVPGATAPDLKLVAMDGGPLHLSELWKTKPLFLVFGSCT